MAVTMQQIVETQLKVIDDALGPLRKIADQAAKTEDALKKATKAGGHGGKEATGWFEKLEGTFHALIPAAGSLGVALGLHGVISTTESYLKKLKEVKELTGATASETDFLFSNARKAGVEYDQMQRVMFQLSRKGSMLEQTMSAAAGKVPGMAEKFKRLGVTMDKGPVTAISSMADAVKAGKLDAGDLMAQFRVPPGQVNDFKAFLEKLDTNKLAASKAGGAGLISDQDIEDFGRLEDAQNRIADAWNRIQVMLGKKLVPIMADFAEKIGDKLENVWLPAAVKFGQFLTDHMEQIVFLAKSFVAVMTAKKLLNVLEGMASPSGLLGKLAAGGFKGLAGGGGAAFAGIGAQIGTITAAFTAALPVLAAIAAVVGVIYLGYKAINDNVGGIKDRLLELWDSIRARFDLIGDSLNSLWETISGIFGESGTLTDFIGRVAALSFEKAVQGLDFVIHLVQTVISYFGEVADQIGYLWEEFGGGIRGFFSDIGNFLSRAKDSVMEFFMAPLRMLEQVSGVVGRALGLNFDKLKDISNPVKEIFEAPMAQFMRHWNKTQAATEGRASVLKQERLAAEAKGNRREATEARPPAPNFDFRGSKFDITQKFAEGFDPDRIAVAFANDLASLGELKSQSGFAPLFAAR